MDKIGDQYKYQSTKFITHQAQVDLLWEKLAHKYLVKVLVEDQQEVWRKNLVKKL